MKKNEKKFHAVGMYKAGYPMCAEHGYACLQTSGFMHSHDRYEPMQFYCDESCHIGACADKNKKKDVPFG